MDIFVIISEAGNCAIDRRAIERIEGSHYKLKMTSKDLGIKAGKVYSHLKENEFNNSTESFNVFHLSEFTQSVNDQELDNLTNNFIAYVTAEFI